MTLQYDFTVFPIVHLTTHLPYGFVFIHLIAHS